MVAIGKELRERVNSLTVNPVLWDCLLAPYTSFGIGGPAAAVVTVESPEELGHLLHLLKENDIPYRFIGRGTNLLVKDAGFAGFVLVPGKGLATITTIDETTSGSVVLRVGAGCSLAKLLNWCVEKSYTGLEFVTGIPGSLGGAVVMNAGAWGGQMADVIGTLTTMNDSAEIEFFKRDQLHFSYRSWDDQISEGRVKLVLAADIILSHGEKSEVRAVCQAYQEKRRKKQPRGMKNCGSFFKNPEGDSAGRLIDASGLKGRCCGDAMVSDIHANFLVNKGAAAAEDVMKLMQIVQDQVAKDSGIVLESEIHFI